MKTTVLNLFSITLVIFLFSSRGEAQLNGNYTIGGTAPNYTTIQAAVTDLNTQGVSGNVVFKLRTGNYDERVTIGIVAGVSMASQITFESETGDSSDVWWTSTSTNDATNYIVKCETARFVNFKKISFRNSGFGSGVFILSNGTSNCHIENCHLTKLTVPTNIYSRHIQIYSINTVDSNIYILNNKLENAGYGIISNGQNSTLRDSNLVITGNVITGYQGILLENVENCDISKNKINVQYYGISITGFGNPTKINGNDVNTSDKALLLQTNQNNASPLASLWITNNFLIGRKGACSILSGNGVTQIVNNSIYNKYWGTGYDALVISTSCGLSNNILVNQDEGRVLNISSTSSTVISDYNLMFTNGTVLVKRGSANFSTLQNWQNYILGQDQHSFQQPPFFVSPFDLHILSNSYLYNNAQVNSQVTVDIDGEPRSGFPDIGADEFVQPAVEAELYPIYQGLGAFDCPGLKTLQVKVKNNGTDTLTTAVIKWSLNGAVQAPINWTGNIPYNQLSTPIDLQFNLAQDSAVFIKIWVSNPNGVTDINVLNDTLIIDTVKTRMNGVYYVGNASLHYSTIQEAADALELRGICGNVTISLENGTYSEYITLNSIAHNTAQDSLFFVSTSGIRDSVIWTQLNSDEWCIELFNVSNVIFRDIKFRKYGPEYGYYSCARIYTTTDSNFEFNNCIFENPGHPYASTGIYFQRGDNLRVKNCLFRQLRRGIEQIGNGNQVPPQDEMLLVEGCEFQNMTEYGIVTESLRDLYIRKNHFTNTWGSQWGGVFGGMYLRFVHGDLRIEENKFDGEFSELISLAFYGTTGNNGRIQNNFFSCKYNNPNSGLTLINCGIVGSSDLEIFHNSFNVIHWPNNGSPTRLMGSFIMNSTLNYSLIIKDNSFKADSAKNVYYGCWPGVGNPNIAYNNISVGHLVDGYDYSTGMTLPPNTTLINPSYVSLEDLHLIGEELMGLGIDVGVQYDIDSTLRPNPPTIGAVEAVPRNYDIVITDSYGVTNCDSVSFMVDVLNNGHMAIDSVWIYTTVNASTDSILSIVTIQPGASQDSIFLIKLPLVRNTSYTISVESLLVDSTDQFPVNNVYDWNITYPETPIPDLGNDTLICFGSVFPLTVVPSTVYSSIIWNNGQATGTYSFNAEVGQNVLQISDDYGCEFFDTIQIAFDPNPALSISFMSDTLFGNGQTGDWYLNNTLLEQNVAWVVPESQGSYYYIWVSSAGCEYQSPIYNYSEAGLADLENAEPTIFPNPFDDYLQVDFENDLTSAVIYDTQMKKVGDFPVLNGKMDTGILSSGIYFIELRLDSERIFTRKIIKL